MKFIWPGLLWLMLLLPLLVALYFWLLARKRRTTVRLASVAVAKLALGSGQPGAMPTRLRLSVTARWPLSRCACTLRSSQRR